MPDGGGAGFGEPFRRVVIGDGEDGDTVLRRQRDECLRRERAVGGRRVRMEVDGAQAISRR
jgi:hypothetical protein